MKNILVTGGTVFVSKYIAKYYTSLGDKVHVLNRNHHPQPEGTYLIEADRHHLGEVLKNYFLMWFWTSTDMTGRMSLICLMVWESLEIIFSSARAQCIRSICRSPLRKR